MQIDTPVSITFYKSYRDSQQLLQDQKSQHLGNRLTTVEGSFKSRRAYLFSRRSGGVAFFLRRSLDRLRH
jgi:hypothetical protein